MDAVIAFVDMNDLDWQKLYYFYVKNKIDVSRYRDWGTLKYVLRGIQYNMPFIDKVHLVLMQESQIPSWLNVNADNLHIVYHKDFVPAKYLPTFNCNTLELHLHKIPDLAEQFIYFNDDMIPIHPSAPTDYFIDNNIIMGYLKMNYEDWFTRASGRFYDICSNSENLARTLVGKEIIEYKKYTWRPEHSISPMLKTLNDFVYKNITNKWKDSTCTTIRNGSNLNQYLYLDYAYHINRLIVHPCNYAYITPPKRWDYNAPDITPDIFLSMLNNAKHVSTICINDAFFPPNDIKTYIDIADKFLLSLLPDKSKFEL